MMDQLRVHSFFELWHPGVLGWILLLQVGYLLAVGPWRKAFGWGPEVSFKTKFWFSLAIWLVYLSEGTPLHTLAEKYLMFAHMIQHQLLTSIMVPILIMGIPEWAWEKLLSRPIIGAIWKRVTHPVPAVLLFNLIYAIWHMPAAYQSVLFTHWFHIVQHALLVLTSVFMWWPIVSPSKRFPQLTEGLQMLYIFVAGITQVITYASLTFAESALYPFYANAPRVIGLDAVSDQQLAGLIMNTGGMITMVFVWVVVFFRWVGREEGKSVPGRKKATV